MPKKVSEEHAELFHYTGAAGLAGILESQTLRATHYSYLNDSEEVRLFFDRGLRSLLEAEVREGLRSLANAPGNQKLIDEIGGFKNAVTDSLNGLVTGIRQSTIAFNEPYMLSFCSSRSPSVRSDGLLSQWRGYGKEGGYAIVFDPLGIEVLLEMEESTFHYQHVQIGDVHYYDDKESSEVVQLAEEIQQAQRVLKASVLEFLLNHDPARLEPTYEAVTTLSCLTKHWGFHEECEVRVVMVPAEHSVAAQAQSVGFTKPLKPRRFFNRDGCPVPYISLFDKRSSTGQKQSLPISRIIVGPHRDKERRKHAVELLLEAHEIEAKVSTSDIPYIGN